MRTVTRTAVLFLAICAVAIPASAEECRINDLGALAPLEIPDIDIQPTASQEALVAGELWTIYAQLKNRTTHPVWISERKTALEVPPELWGVSSNAGATPAFFGTKLHNGKADNLIRLDPGGSYIVSWKIDPFANARSTSDGFVTIKRLAFLVGEYLFFRPGKYSLASNTHIWSTLPCIIGKEVVNLGESVVLSASTNITVHAPQPVLIFGAVVGGIACFALQIMLRIRRTSFETAGGVRFLLLGFFTAVLLCSLGTILASRLSAPEFLIAVRIQDFWGAIATGFVVQWFGLNYLSQQLDSLFASNDSPVPNGDAKRTARPSRSSPA